jgi:hypothetical protein
MSPILRENHRHDPVVAADQHGEASVTVHTPAPLRRINRRYRRNATKRRHEHTAASLIQAMRNGASLHRCNRNHRVLWSLSTGEFITHEAATDALGDPHLVGVGDCLFGPELSQTFHYID